MRTRRRFLASLPAGGRGFELHEALELKGALGADAEKGWSWDVTVLAFGKSKRAPHFVYTKEAATKSIGAFDGAKVYALTVTDEGGHASNPNHKSTRDIVGVITSPKVTDTELQATLTLYPSAKWMRDNLLAAFEKNIPLPYELSIDATGRAYQGEHAGERLPIVESFDRVSVDTVERGAAGGRFNRLRESKLTPEPTQRSSTMKDKLLFLFTLLYPAFLEGKKVDVTSIDENGLYTHLLEADKPQPRLHLPDGAQLTEALLDEKITRIREGLLNPPAPPAKQAAPAQGEPKALEDVTKRLEAQELRACAMILESTLKETKLPKDMQDLLRGEFAGRVFKEADLAARITAVNKAFSKFLEGIPGLPPGTDPTNVRMGTTDNEKVVAGINGFFLRESIKPLTDEEKKKDLLGVPGFRSIREAYIAYTGDEQVTGLKSRSTRLTESLQTTDWAEVVAAAINKRMVRDYPLLGLDTWRTIADVVSLKDFRTQRRIRYGGYGNLPIRAQGNPYAALSSPTDEEATYTPATRGGTEDLTRELIMNDDVGAVGKIPTRMMRAAAWTLHEFVFAFVNPAVNANIYDGTALYTTGGGSHLNYNTAALASDGVALGSARVRMMKQLEKDSGKRLGLRLRYLLVPADLESVADGLTRPAFGQNNSDPTFLQAQRIVPIVVPSWTDATDWAAAADPMDLKGLEVGFINGQETPEVFVSDVANVGSWFTNDKLTYKIRHEYGGVITDFRAFDGSVVA